MQISHFDENDKEHSPKAVEFLPIFNGQTFAKAFPYPVIVESWHKKDFGKGKRAWLEQFTEQERKTIGTWHAKFYKWYLVTGTPERVAMKLTTWELLQRALNFFGTI